MDRNKQAILQYREVITPHRLERNVHRYYRDTPFCLRGQPVSMSTSWAHQGKNSAGLQIW